MLDSQWSQSIRNLNLGCIFCYIMKMWKLMPLSKKQNKNRNSWHVPLTLNQLHFTKAGTSKAKETNPIEKSPKLKCIPQFQTDWNKEQIKNKTFKLIYNHSPNEALSADRQERSSINFSFLARYLCSGIPSYNDSPISILFMTDDLTNSIFDVSWSWIPRDCWSCDQKIGIYWWH